MLQIQQDIGHPSHVCIYTTCIEVDCCPVQSPMTTHQCLGLTFELTQWP